MRTARLLSDLTTITTDMREHPKLVGDRTTLAVMLALVDVGLRSVGSIRRELPLRPRCRSSRGADSSPVQDGSAPGRRGALCDGEHVRPPTVAARSASSLHRANRRVRRVLPGDGGRVPHPDRRRSLPCDRVSEGDARATASASASASRATTRSLACTARARRDREETGRLTVLSASRHMDDGLTALAQPGGGAQPLRVWGSRLDAAGTPAASPRSAPRGSISPGARPRAAYAASSSCSARSQCSVASPGSPCSQSR